MNGLAAALFVAGVPAAYGINRVADLYGPERLRGRTAAVHAATPILFGACGLAFGVHPRVAVAVFYCAVLVALAAIDAERRIIPNRIVLPSALIVLAAQTLIEPSVEWVIAGVAASAFFLIAAIAYPAGMGMGDVKLALLLGFMLGRGVAAGIAIGLLASMIPAIVILIRHGSAGRKMGIPLAPFLAFGGAVALFTGARLVNAWLGL